MRCVFVRTIPHGEQGAIELLKPAAGGACHQVLRAGVSIWSSAADEQVMADGLAAHGVESVVEEAGKVMVAVGSGEHQLALRRC